MALLSQVKLKHFRSLKLKKFRQLKGQFLIEGIKLCQEAFKANVHINTLLYDPKIVSSKIINEFQGLCKERSIPYYELTYEMLNDLSDTVNSQGVIGIVNKNEPNPNLESAELILAMDAARDPGNLGTLVRTADWFGVDAILIGQGSVDLYNPKVLRSTMGSIFHLPLFNNVNLKNLLNQLKKQGFSIYASDVHGDQIYNEIEFANKKILIVGNETKGISSEIASLCNVTLKIPPKGKAESLNMAIATGIILSQMVNYDNQ